MRSLLDEAQRRKHDALWFVRCSDPYITLPYPDQTEHVRAVDVTGCRVMLDDPERGPSKRVEVLERHNFVLRSLHTQDMTKLRACMFELQLDENDDFCLALLPTVESRPVPKVRSPRAARTVRAAPFMRTSVFLFGD
jgi:hypothetical protein